MQRDRELKSPDILIHLWYSHVYTVHSFRSHVFVITLVISFNVYVLPLCARAHGCSCQCTTGMPSSYEGQKKVRFPRKWCWWGVVSTCGERELSPLGSTECSQSWASSSPPSFIVYQLPFQASSGFWWGLFVLLAWVFFILNQLHHLPYTATQIMRKIWLVSVFDANKPWGLEICVKLPHLWNLVLK